MNWSIVHIRDIGNTFTQNEIIHRLNESTSKLLAFQKNQELYLHKWKHSINICQMDFILLEI